MLLMTLNHNRIGQLKNSAFLVAVRCAFRKPEIAEYIVR